MFSAYTYSANIGAINDGIALLLMKSIKTEDAIQLWAIVI